MRRLGWAAIVLLALAYVALATSAAWATPPDNRPPDNRPPDRGSPGGGGDATATGGNAESSAQADSTAVSDAQSTSQANAQVTVNVTPGTAPASQAASNTLTVNQAAQPSSIKIKNTPTAIAPDIMPTIACFKTASGAVSFPGFGAAGAGGKIDPSCVKREYIRLAYAMGAADRALWMWCQQPEVWMDFGGVADCLLFDATEPAARRPDPAGTLMVSLNQAIDEPILLAQNVQREELEEEVLEPMQEQQAIIEAQEARLRALEQRLEAQARAAERAERRREEFKQQLAEKYLEPQEATEEEPEPTEESEK